MPQWNADVNEGAWLGERIHGSFETVGSIVPQGFAAYARVFHPLERLAASRWADLAIQNGRVVHSGMQYHLISRPPGEHADVHEHYEHMAVGDLPSPELRLLVDVLDRQTMPDEVCFFAVWEGFGQLHGGSSVAVLTSTGAAHPPGIAPPLALEGPRVELPHRSYLLLSGALGEVLDLRNMLGGQSPNLWWPSSRSWCVATEIDFGWTYVAGSRSLVDDLLSAEGLELLECRVTDGLHDLLNADLDGEARRGGTSA